MIKFRKYSVLPGQFIITGAPTLISTILGSCVSVCLWDKKTKTGGMNHYLLSGKEGDEPGNSNRGLTAIPLLIRCFLNRKVAREDLEAKIFGGCNSLQVNHDHFKIGERNIAMAIEILKKYDIKIAAQHVGGSYGREIIMNTESGKIEMRLIKKLEDIDEEGNKSFGY